ncbi:hypothetical protein GCM10022280_14000 [Sphingomonas swuensis]|uniref:Uncharacterized protein n=1 Tax=Sphingomonas swuensis TaxID=977800 RepID=A0ABP7STS3_9SPHN
MMSALLLAMLLQSSPLAERNGLPTSMPPVSTYPSRIDSNLVTGRYDSVDIRAAAGDRLLIDRTLKVSYSEVGARGDATRLLDESCRRKIGDAGFKLLMSPVARDAASFRVAASYRPDASCASDARTAVIDQVVMLERGKPVVLQGADGLRLELKRR